MVCSAEQILCSRVKLRTDPFVLFGDVWCFRFLFGGAVVNKLASIAVRGPLRCFATNRKVAGSIPDGVIGIFHRHKILPIALWPWGWLGL